VLICVLGIVGGSGVQWGEWGDGPGHPRQEGNKRVKSQTLKCC